MDFFFLASCTEYVAVWCRMAGKAYHNPRPFPSECYEFSLTDHHEDPRLQPRQQGDYGIRPYDRPLIRRANARYNLRPAPSNSPAAATGRSEVPPTTHAQLDSRGQATTAHEGDLPLSCSTWDYDSESRQALAAADQPPLCSEGNTIRKRSLEARTTSGHTSLAFDDSGLLPLTSPDTAEEQGENVKRDGPHNAKKKKQQPMQDDSIHSSH